ncbi:sulfofructose kinase [Paucimonas lemoignei]|uniref:Sulfofructose kinase n=1 Tax=Paucimonas lemoignei TaxID=29443 RepID=A0A4R3HYK8_PAULE|nr:sugar kinase [Paucimonas lemoignei]TCS36569.1 sulfofructose kinase [Paucimonas lemoignei]
MKTRVICLGITTLDRVWPVEELPTGGGKYRASDYLEVGGGMAANAAVAAARLGADCAYWGRAGDDTAGVTMQREMTAYGVDIRNFRLFPGARSSISAVLVSQDGERTIVNYRGTGIPDDPSWLPLDQVAEAAAIHADIRWVEGAAAIFSAARKAAIPTVLDGETADTEAFAVVLPWTDHAIFSEPGLRSFAGPDCLQHEASRRDALAKVRELGCRVAAVTCGSKGTLWLDEQGFHHLPAFAVKVVDTTGAGDVFHGAYALALGEGQKVAQAMRFASAVAALKCTRQGGRAGIPTRAEVEEFLATH